MSTATVEPSPAPTQTRRPTKAQMAAELAAVREQIAEAEAAWNHAVLVIQFEADRRSYCGEFDTIMERAGMPRRGEIARAMEVWVLVNDAHRRSIPVVARSWNDAHSQVTREMVQERCADILQPDDPLYYHVGSVVTVEPQKLNGARSRRKRIHRAET